MLLLGWEKAFDKIDREGLMNALRRVSVDPKLVKLVESVYKKTEFCIEIDGTSSDWQTQETGIRQGCPLSPYLFLIVMTVMFHDIHREVDMHTIQYRLPGADFDEVSCMLMTQFAFAPTPDRSTKC